jgi:FixJ family two-component response regulator
MGPRSNSVYPAARISCYLFLPIPPSTTQPRVAAEKPATYPVQKRTGLVHPVDNQSETICILDDDASVLKAMRRLLRSAGLPVLAFNEAHAFLQYVEKNAVALAIIDIWMPEINGLEVQRKLLELAPSIPVIMMTGRDAPAMRSVALSQGAAAFFAKPFPDEAFLEAIHEALGAC